MAIFKLLDFLALIPVFVLGFVLVSALGNQPETPPVSADNSPAIISTSEIDSDLSPTTPAEAVIASESASAGQEVSQPLPNPGG
jgi:hypothetical protein